MLLLPPMQVKPVEMIIQQMVSRRQMPVMQTLQQRGQTDGMVGSAEEPAMKLQKIEEHGVEPSGTTSATEESVLELVASRDGVSRHPNILSEARLEAQVVPVVVCLSADGSICFQVLLDDVVKHFNGSKRESVVDILDSLESEFEIYKKNGKYMIM